MTTIAERIAEDILELPMNDRAALAHRLIQSLDDEPDSDAEAIWIKEIDRRSADIKDGQVLCRPVNDVISDIRQKLQNARIQSS